MWFFFSPFMYKYENTVMAMDKAKQKGDELKRDFANANAKYTGDLGEKIFQYSGTDFGWLIRKIAWCILLLISVATLIYSFAIPSHISENIGMFAGFLLVAFVWIIVVVFVIKVFVLGKKFSFYAFKHTVVKFSIVSFIYASLTALILIGNIVFLLVGHLSLTNNYLSVFLLQIVSCLSSWIMWLLIKTNRITYITDK